MVQIRLDKKVGNTVGEILSSADRVGYVIVQGIDADDAVTACEKATFGEVSDGEVEK